MFEKEDMVNEQLKSLDLKQFKENHVFDLKGQIFFLDQCP